MKESQIKQLALKVPFYFFVSSEVCQCKVEQSKMANELATAKDIENLPKNKRF